MQIVHSQAPVILVVEDEVLVRDCAVAQLQEAGFGVIAAGDAEAALHEFEERPDVTTVFTDINMPGRFDGLSLAHMIFRLRPQVQLIVTSGVRPDRSAMPAGVHFLAKPYDCNLLSAVFNAA